MTAIQLSSLVVNLSFCHTFNCLFFLTKCLFLKVTLDNCYPHLFLIFTLSDKFVQSLLLPSKYLSKLSFLQMSVYAVLTLTCPSSEWFIRDNIKKNAGLKLDHNLSYDLCSERIQFVPISLERQLNSLLLWSDARKYQTKHHVCNTMATT